jgi:hypothetical protein
VRALTLDRGNILARAFADQGGRTPYEKVMSLRAAVVTKTNDLPVYVDNATLAGGVARVLVSPLRLTQGLTNNTDTVERCGAMLVQATLHPCDLVPAKRERDLVQVLGPNRDMPILSAATLGARFPVITAPGYVKSCSGAGTLDHDSSTTCDSSSSMSDGGFLENTGLMTITDVLPDIYERVAYYNRHHSTRYAIYVVELDNHARAEASSGQINSATAATTVVNITNAMNFIEGYARESVINYVGSACYDRIYPRTDPAAGAPTGWLLSDEAERGLARSLDSQAWKYAKKRNGAETKKKIYANAPLRTFVRWVDGITEDPRCVPWAAPAPARRADTTN